MYECANFKYSSAHRIKQYTPSEYTINYLYAPNKVWTISTINQILPFFIDLIQLFFKPDFIRLR